MLEKIKEMRSVTEVKETVVGEVLKCDICGKVIFDSRNDTEQQKRTGMSRDQYWWGLTTGHSDWGNDSADSIESFDICSPDEFSLKVGGSLRRSIK